MSNTSIKSIKPLQLPWVTQDPFIFCSYHLDNYPGGNENLGPNTSLVGRNIGQDFAGMDGWNMYHGQDVPGFPAHPHCGFETVTIVTKGFVDHSDSLGGKGRFGNGDVQWLTSGKGVQHSEMFPLLDAESNPFEIFQLWLNLPAKSKKVDPNYKMLWNQDIPVQLIEDTQNRVTRIRLIAGTFANVSALNPTPDSWAADPKNHVQIWTLRMDEHAEFELPSLNENVNRSLYFYEGKDIEVDGIKIQESSCLVLNPEKATQIKNGTSVSYLLFLQGRPINEPLVQHGPFVANSQEEIQEAMSTFRRTQFGGWPWESSGPVHGTAKRFSDLSLED